MVISDRTKGCCSSDLNEPPHPNHDQFAELDAHNLFAIQMVVDQRGQPALKNAVGPIGRRHSARLAVHQLILQRVAGIPIEKFLDRHPNWNFG
jgi:hypothetical protein